MNRFGVMGIILAMSLVSVGAAHGEKKPSTNSSKEESMRIVLSKVSSIGTAKGNSSIKPVSGNGIRMSALVTGDRWSQGSGGNFAATEKVVQLNFVLPSRMSIADTETSICLDRLEALRAGGATAPKLELNFEGRRVEAGNYIVHRVLGCGDIAAASTQPVLKPTPKPTPKVTPKPATTPVQILMPTATPRR